MAILMVWKSARALFIIIKFIVILCDTWRLSKEQIKVEILLILILYFLI